MSAIGFLRGFTTDVLAGVGLDIKGLGRSDLTLASDTCNAVASTS